jgi:hypothetical protein
MRTRAPQVKAKALGKVQTPSPHGKRIPPEGEGKIESTTNFKGQGFRRFRTVAAKSKVRATRILPAKGR